MLKIDTNGTIKYSRGDDVKFPLFLNQGTRLNPIRYVFKGDELNITSTNKNLKITYDIDIWKTMIEEIGEYIFTYDDEGIWIFKDSGVDINTYGVYIEGTPNENDQLDIIYSSDDGCEVYFYLFQPNDEKPFFEKTFTPNKDLWRGKLENEEPNGDMKITLLGTDRILYPRENIITLADIPPGKYFYKIKAKLLDHELLSTGEISYVMNTVTNRLPIYIVDDNFDRLY